MPVSTTITESGTPLTEGGIPLTESKTLELYLDGVLINTSAAGGFVPSSSLDNAVQAYQSAPEFSYKARIKTGDGTAFPFTPVKGMQTWYGLRDSADHNADVVLFTGRLERIQWTDESVHGTYVLTFLTPLKVLKMVMEHVVFSPDPTTGYPNDAVRVRRLFELANLDAFDHTTATTLVPSITYPDGEGLEFLTIYDRRTVEEILDDIASDPGQVTDTGYPVKRRRWWISGRFTNPDDPLDGVTWVLNYQHASEVTYAALQLTDQPDGTNAWYESGATYTEEAREMIRAINIAGPVQPSYLVTWQNYAEVNPGVGQITKDEGTNDWGDTGAISVQRYKGGDFEAQCTVQEFFLAHDVFWGPLAPKLGKAARGGFWEHIFSAGDTVENTMGPFGFNAAHAWKKEGLARAVLECKASTVILRAEAGTMVAGWQLIYRLSDDENYFRVESTGAGGDYLVIKRVAGVDTILFSFGSPANDDDVKVFVKDDEHFFFVNDVPATTSPLVDSFNQDETKHGIGVDCDAASDSWTATFRDFECTDFFADKAFGMGTETVVRDWPDISYGFIFNINGTVTLNEGGSTFAGGDYTYNDSFRVSTFLHFEAPSASFNRWVRWEKLPASASQWVVLRERTSGVVSVSEGSPWYVQFAAKELGATLNNIQTQKMYSNLFYAQGYSAAFGDWPANGVLQSDDLDTFAKRQARADAVFKHYAEPRRTFQATVRYPAPDSPRFQLGETVYVRSRKWGWTVSPDTRKQLVVRSIKRIESPGFLPGPSYQVELGDEWYEVSDRPRKQLLTGKKRTRIDNRILPTQNGNDPTVFDFPDSDNPERNGDLLGVQVAPFDAEEWLNADWPIQWYPANSKAIRVPQDALRPGSEYGLRHITYDTKTGADSGWSELVPFIAPVMPSYSRPYTVQHYFGNGVDEIEAGVYHQVQLPESGQIIGWSVVCDEGTPAGDLTVDVQYAIAANLRDLGPASSYNSITGTDKPRLSGQEYNESNKLTGWTTDVYAHDWLRFEVEASPTPTALKATVTLFIRRESEET